ncbi:hypothetical protein JWV37_10495 [Sulfurospirillum sp. T05]|uniref:Uncharacterized protein n=1 Tax=Sulfurospirillum tamanense TaxID=2813362 RepID=A0ABS2WU96_9BACT|nr:hypothetical protein [Sulfurospirillum tamanensis]MBN2965211.1 hypothetical protein [Sulfurospirillum tamanensis]
MISLIVGLSVFLGWMSLVGNPHVVETSMGLIISIIVAVWISHKINPWKMPK